MFKIIHNKKIFTECLEPKLNQIDEFKAAVDSKPELPLQYKIDNQEYFLVHNTYHSNKIKGNLLEFKEVEHIILRDSYSKKKPFERCVGNS